MKLWKETFHDSDEYIRLVFDTYFSPDNVCVRYDGEKLVASLLSVDYQFLIPDGYAWDEGFIATYLCGLATRPEYRNRGIMTSLMEEAERKAGAKGSAMTFLIPADDHLREYYRRHGYRNASYRKHENLKNGDSSSAGDLNIYSVRNFLNNEKFLNELALWCCAREKKFKYPTMLHSVRDMVAVLSENENSFFLSKGSVDAEYSILAKMEAVVFPDESDEEFVRVVGLYLRNGNDVLLSENEDAIIPMKIVNAISEKYKNRNVEFALPYSGNVGDEKNVSPYAMVKWIGDDRDSGKNENLNFRISLMLD